LKEKFPSPIAELRRGGETGDSPRRCGGDGGRCPDRRHAEAERRQVMALKSCAGGGYGKDFARRLTRQAKIVGNATCGSIFDVRIGGFGGHSFLPNAGYSGDIWNCSSGEVVPKKYKSKITSPMGNSVPRVWDTHGSPDVHLCF